MMNGLTGVPMGRMFAATALLLACGAACSAREAATETPVTPDRAAAAEQSAYLARLNKRAAPLDTSNSTILCYPDNLSQEDFDRIMRENQFLPPGLEGPTDERFWVDNRVWTGDGLQGISGQAGRARLTYSFPADGVTWGLATIAAVGPNVLNASFNTTFGAANNDRGREHVRQGFASWHKYVGLDYDEVSDDGTPMDNTEARSPTRGDTRIGGRAYGTGSFLAYNGFPSPNGVFGVNGGGGGDMMINTSFFIAANYNNAANLYRYFRNTIAHEHGHGTGNIHSVACNNTKLMEPFISTVFDVVQIDERRGGGRNYGDRFSGNNSAANAVNAGDLTTRSYIARWLSTNGATGPNNTNQDWFRFSLASAQTVSITVTPVGGTYTAGQQSGGCSGTTASIASSSAGNLNVSLRDNAGTTNLFPAQGNTAAAGATETVNAGSLSAGTYTVQVIDVGPNPAANQTVQLYDITIRVTGTLADPWPIAGINKRVAANTNCWLIGDMNSQTNETGATIPTPSGYDWDSDGDGTFDTNDQPQFSRTYPSNGVYPVTLRLTDSNGRSATDTINVTVFGATASISSVAPANGNTGTAVPVTINGVNLKSLTSATQVAVSGTGVTVTGTGVPNALGTSVTGFSFQIAPLAVVGMRNVSVLNSDGSGTVSGDATLNSAFLVQSPPTPPGPFNLVSPVDGATNVSLTPTLSWAAAPGAVTYNLRVSNNPTLTPSIFTASSLVTTFANVAPATLSQGQTYYWGVTATNGNGTTASTPAAFSFITVPPACVGDLNNDGNRDVNDLTLFLSFFGTAVTPGTNGDLDNDGQVNVNDLTLFLSVFGVPCP
ncbi:MAG: PKD domain-containing protein [Phycisphaerales bacterium]